MYCLTIYCIIITKQNQNCKRKNEKKKVGPGRKSTAVIAMEFYEYLLGHNEEISIEDEEQQQNNDDNNDQLATRATSDEDEDENRSSSCNQPSNSDCEDSINAQVIVKQQRHEDTCNFCHIRGGDVICCTTCSFVFHKECLRPITKTVTNDWSCPYCIVQGKRGYKRHSKTFRRAETGIRQMKRMRSEKEKEPKKDVNNLQKTKAEIVTNNQDMKLSGSTSMIRTTSINDVSENNVRTIKNAKDKSDPEKIITTVDSLISPKDKIKEQSEEIQNSDKKPIAMTPKKELRSAREVVYSSSLVASGPSSCGDEIPTKKRKNLALFKIADSYTPNSTESLMVRGSRHRKQPAMYQPQLCADSRWQSDEISGENQNGDIVDSENDDSEDSEDDSNDDDEDDDDDSYDNGNDDDEYDDNSLNIDPGSDSKNEQKIENAVENKEVDTRRIPEDHKIYENNSEGNTSHQREIQNERNSMVCTMTESINEKRAGKIWCIFCHDDPQIEICVFCGCRRCFGKHDKTSLLLCDNCDDEYHTFCLGLSTVPLEQRWFCPNCEKKKGPDNPLELTRKSRAVNSTYATCNMSDSSATNSTPIRRSKATFVSIMTKSDHENNISHKKKGAAAAPTKKYKVVAEGKRARGRPPKNKNETDSISRKRGRAVDKSKNKTNKIKAGRKRGRPPKSSQPPAAKRKRGRPPKVKSDDPAPSMITLKKEEFMTKEKPKIITTAVINNKKDIIVSIESAFSKQREIVKVSRISGRTVKRASFYDEIEEGEQHLSSKFFSRAILDSQISRKKVSESDPRRKQRINKKKEEDAYVQIVTAPSCSEPQSTISRVEPATRDIKKETMNPPPIAPVRMKPVVQRPDTATWSPILHSDPSKPEVEKGRSMVEADKPVLTTHKDQKVDRFDVAVPFSNNPEPAPTTQSSSLLQPVNQSVTVQKAAKTVDFQNAQRGPSNLVGNESHRTASTVSDYPSTPLLDTIALQAAVKARPVPNDGKMEKEGFQFKNPRRKPGARECMQIVKRFGVDLIPENHMNVLLDYSRRGKVEHLIRMRERLDCHSRFLESQLAGLEILVKGAGESNSTVAAFADKGAEIATNISTNDCGQNVESTMAGIIPVSSSFSSTSKVAASTVSADHTKPSS